jgi:alpha/beta superfamily hydrolase
VALKAVAKGLSPTTLALISPPVDFTDFGDLALPACPCLIVCGDADDFCSERSMRRWLDPQMKDREDVTVQILPRTDHFYFGREGPLEDSLRGFFA